MKKHLKIVLCLAACLCLALAIDGTVNASTTRDANSTVSGSGILIEYTFPDAGFQQYVRDYFDTDQDGYLSDAEIAAATEIDAVGPGTSFGSVQGIDKLNALPRIINHVKRVLSSHKGPQNR